MTEDKKLLLFMLIILLILTIINAGCSELTKQCEEVTAPTQEVHSGKIVLLKGGE